MAIEVMISEKQIAERIKSMARDICADFSGEELVVLGVLNGSFLFLGDLVREMDIPLRVEFLKVSSYGESTESSGKLDISLWPSYPMTGKNVLIVEDIVDTGLTISQLFKRLSAENPKSLKLASLLYKPSRTKHTVPIDYLGFEIADKFVIGYGLDFAGKFRELPYIGVYCDD